MSISVQTDKVPTGAATSRRTPWARRFARPGMLRYAPLFYLSNLGSLICLSLVLPQAINVFGHVPHAVLGAALVLHGLALAMFIFAGRAMQATLLSTAGFVGLVAWATSLTGGMISPFLVLFALAPIESLFTRQPRLAQLVFFGTFLALTVGVVLAAPFGPRVVLSDSQILVMTTAGLLYALALAARILRSASVKDIRTHATRRAIEQFHTITHDVFLILHRDGTVEQAFGALKSVLDCDEDDLTRSGLMHRIHVSDRPAFMATLDGVCAASARDTVEVRMRTGAEDQPQSFIWVEIDLSVATYASGGQEICALVRDISATKQRAVDLTVAREKAEASDAAKGRFLATISHELRTPLNAIIGFADILDEEVFGRLANDQQREYVGLIRESGVHLLQLVNDLLDMSKLDAGHFHIVAEPFPLATVVDRCTRLIGQQIEKAELTLSVDLPPDLPEIVADQRAIRQVLINLLSNACKFTPAGGSIQLRARKDGPYLVLTVSDTGIGISRQDLGKIGQPFFQANNAYDRNIQQGTGLGLSVVKGLSELHDGSFSVSSVEGEGTTVTVRLPFAGPAESVATQPTTQNQANTVVLAKLQNTLPAVAPDETDSDPHDTVQQEGQRAHG